MRTPCHQPLVILCLLAIVQLAGIALFARGFFPYKMYLPGFTNASQTPSWPNQSRDPLIIEPEYDRLVFMVVDALRKYVYKYGVGG